ncbi:hypothetical protein CEXT_284801 [Caerostris extrusa]|uniref:Uncharacterized protein n=1 Tax=Caerostris extrusa TaxID=172846 RepID=A0AAV4XJ82_CAEEX|nr:hypothetical protein CEXT_284801 [Caerostris extrusa]
MSQELMGLIQVRLEQGQGGGVPEPYVNNPKIWVTRKDLPSNSHRHTIPQTKDNCFKAQEDQETGFTCHLMDSSFRLQFKASVSDFYLDVR